MTQAVEQGSVSHLVAFSLAGRAKGGRDDGGDSAAPDHSLRGSDLRKGPSTRRRGCSERVALRLLGSHTGPRKLQMAQAKS